MIEAGTAKENQGAFDAACADYREAIRLTPDYPRAWVNLGIASAANAQLDQAIAAYDRALALEPENAPAHYNRGLALGSLGQLIAAEEAFASAIKHRPIFPDAYAALADILERQGRLDAAAAALDTAIQQAPGHPGYVLNLAILRKTSGDLDAAENLLRPAIKMAHSAGEISLAAANLLRDKGRHADACAALEAIIRLSPGSTPASSDLLFTLLFRDDLDPEYVAQRHRELGKRLQQEHQPRFAMRQRNGATRRLLRIGYVSGDFKRHSVALFMLPVIENHDRQECEVYCYSNSEHQDDVTSRFRKAADVWRDVWSCDDSIVAQLVHDDAIDILLDLSGHSSGNRLGVFAHKPSPVQATWLGYLSTTGLPSIGYRICDARTDPIGMTERLHTETLMRMPNSQWCYRPYLSPRHADGPPMLTNRFPTFGSFNQFAKISPTVQDLWAQILAQAPESRLLAVGIPRGESRDRFVGGFEARGVGSDRLELFGRVGLDEYFELFNRVDLALDTFPYTGATTTCDALWMSVPVLTLAGGHSVARSGVSLLTTVGLAELVAETPADYVAKAVSLGQDTARLIDLRRDLRIRLRKSPLMDEARFVRDLEELYRRLWKASC